MKQSSFAKFAGKWKVTVPLHDVAATLVRPPYDPASDPARAVPRRTGAGMFAAGHAPKVVSPRYTGDKVIGTAIMHKSALVPVFSSAEAEEIARMRR